jgi:flagellar biosynthesis protein FlhG
VGKTWFAISLAASLTRSGLRALLVDGDLGLANVDVQLGLMPTRDLGHLIDDGLSLGEAVTACPDGGFDVLAGRAGSATLSTLSATALEKFLVLLSGALDYDVILVDLGAGIDRSLRRIACWADTLLVVATDEPTALTDAYVVIKVHAADRERLCATIDGMPGADVRIVVNQADNEGAGRQTYDTLARVSVTYLQLKPALAGIIRRDERVRDAIRSQACFPLRYPLAPAALDIERIVEGLAAEISRART